MFRNSGSILAKCFKESELYKAGDYSMTLAEVQDVLDAYVADGYTIHDIADGNIDVHLEGATKLVLLWKSAMPGCAYLLKPDYFSGKTVVIMGVKVDGLDAVTDYNLDVWFTGTNTQFIPVTMSCMTPHFERENFPLNFNSIGFEYCTPKIECDIVLNTLKLDNCNVINRRNLNIQNASTFVPAHAENEAIGNKGDEDVITNIPDPMTDWNASTCGIAGGFLYFGGGGSSVLSKLDLETFGVVDTLDVGQDFEKLIIVGRWLYTSLSTSTVVKKVDLNDFSTVTSIDTSTAYPEVMRTDGNYIFLGGNHNFVATIKVEDDSVSSIATSHTTNHLNSDGTYLYAVGQIPGGSTQAPSSQILISTQAVVKEFNSGYGMQTLQAFGDGTYVVQLCSSNYASWLVRTEIATGTYETIDIYNNQYSDLAIFYNDGTYLWLLAGSLKVYKLKISEFVLIEMFQTVNGKSYGFTKQDMASYDGKYFYSITNTTIVRTRYMNPVISVNFEEMVAPDPAIILANDYHRLTCNIKTRFYIPANSTVEFTRLYYILEFVLNKTVNDKLKRFSGIRVWLVHRDDVDAFLCPASPKKIKDYKLYLNDGTTPYAFDELPADENFIILAEDDDGNYVYFLWYNEAVVKSLFSLPVTGKTYTIRRAFHIWKRRQSEVDVKNLKIMDHSDMEGTIEWNNLDNEITDLGV